MHLGWKHRAVTGFLVVLFAVFNIGLPIVVASCPMPRDTQSPSCYACPQPSGGGSVSLTTYIDYSCCQTVILADRNLNEFEIVKRFTAADVKTIAPLLQQQSHAIENSLGFSDFSLVSDPSPPGSSDLPVLFSSLLI